METAIKQIPIKYAIEKMIEKKCTDCNDCNMCKLKEMYQQLKTPTLDNLVKLNKCLYYRKAVTK